MLGGKGFWKSILPSGKIRNAEAIPDSLFVQPVLVETSQPPQMILLVLRKFCSCLCKSSFVAVFLSCLPLDSENSLLPFSLQQSWIFEAISLFTNILSKLYNVYFHLSFLFALQDMQSGCFIEFTISSVTPHCVKDLDKEFAHRLLARAGINLHQPRNRPRIKFLLFYPPGCLMASVRK